MFHQGEHIGLGSNETLISKGLRRLGFRFKRVHLGSNETLISKGLRPNAADALGDGRSVRMKP